MGASRRASAALLCSLCTGAWSDAWGQEAPSSDLPSVAVHAHSFGRTEGDNPLRGSILFFEQSITTTTTDVGATPQSYVPLYELWLSIRPHYWFDKHWSLRGRFDYTKGLTNAEQTTYYREDVFGDLWTDIVYETKLDPLWQKTRANLGLRAIWPTSKQSQANGTFVTAGLLAGAAHEFTIHGDSAPLLNNAHVSLRLTYLHPFTEATTPTSYGNFQYVRQDVDGFSFVSDQIQGQTLVDHEFWTTLEGGLQISPRLSASAFLVLVNQWHYPPSPTAALTATGMVTPSSAGDVQFTQNTWLVASVDYLVLDELELGVGYYNLANAIAPDGQRRSVFGSDNIWWSPDARFFFTATANLDVLANDLSKGSLSRQGRSSSPRSF